jgi:hypothetical protein
MNYSEEDARKYRERMQKADNIQKAGTEMMKMGCAITVLAIFAFIFLMVIIGALA